MTVSTHTEDYIVTDRDGIVDASVRLLYSVSNPARITLCRPGSSELRRTWLGSGQVTGTVSVSRGGPMGAIFRRRRWR